MKKQYTTVFVIREVSTGKLIKFQAKAGWATSGAAKNAFNLHMWAYFKLDRLTDRKGLYDKQNEFVIEEIK